MSTREFVTSNVEFNAEVLEHIKGLDQPHTTIRSLLEHASTTIQKMYIHPGYQHKVRYDYYIRSKLGNMRLILHNEALTGEEEEHRLEIDLWLEPKGAPVLIIEYPTHETEGKSLINSEIMIKEGGLTNPPTQITGPININFGLERVTLPHDVRTPKTVLPFDEAEAAKSLRIPSGIYLSEQDLILSGFEGLKQTDSPIFAFNASHLNLLPISVVLPKKIQTFNRVCL